MQATGPDIGVFWAKLNAGSQDGPTTFHPLVCHLIDVGAVARAMWETVLPAAARRRIAGRLRADEESAGAWVTLWMALHDLGKLSPAFQLRPEAAPLHHLYSGLPSRLVPRAPPHGTITAATLPSILQSEFDLPAPLSTRIATAVGGHHGILPSAAEVRDVAPRSRGNGVWDDMRLALTRALSRAFSLSAGPVTGELSNADALFLAGLASTADWIGSNTVHFPHAVRDPASPPQIDVATYAARAGVQAHEALRQLGWSAWPQPDGPRAFHALFPGIASPNPMQRAVSALGEELPPGGLVIIEAPMGEGKTEAAMYLADRWALALDQRGCYFALPTQATSNQMFTRVGDFLSHRYQGSFVNLQLLHGHASLSAEFETLRLAGDRVFQPRGIYTEDQATEPAANVVAAEWFTHRKRGLLAPFGVGTIDQALLGVLRTPHVFVRLFGLAHKTIIVDEVHAYDAYMTALLERLLQWLGALNCAVVLLSATLPQSKRRALAAAFARGAGFGADETVPGAPYPRVSWVTAGGSGERHVEATASRAIRVRWATDDPGPLVRQLQIALARGGCAAVICNTVGRAQRIFRALLPHFSGTADDGMREIDLLHAQFPFDVREDREQRALVRFGKPGGRAICGGTEVDVRRPSRAVLVSTQVIEQSLDLDFDLLLTDMAPVDLLLQRAGRVHRHVRARPRGLDDPTLWVLKPDLPDRAYPRFGGGTEAVYDSHVLLRSWLALRHRLDDHGAIRIPEEVDGLIEGVYADRPCPADLAAELRDRWVETEHARRAAVAREESEARDRWLRPPSFEGWLWELTSDPREEDAPDFHEAHQALTRLAGPTARIVCLYRRANGQLSLDPEGLDRVDLQRAPNVDLAKRLLRRSLTVSDRRIVFSLLGQPRHAPWQRSALLRHHRLVAFDQSRIARVGDHRLNLDPDVGLELVGTA